MMRVCTLVLIAASRFLAVGAFSLAQGRFPRIQSSTTSRSYLDDKDIVNDLFHSLPGRKTKEINTHGHGHIHRDAMSLNRHSARDWLHNIVTMKRSTVLQEIRNPVLTVTAWSAFVAIAHKVMVSSTSKFCRNFAANMCVPTQAHSFLVSSLGLLLVFRTNSAYQRFVEGRKIWEQILSQSRNLTRMLDLYEDDVGIERTSRIKKTLAAFPYLLRHHVRPNCLDCSNDVPQEFRMKMPQMPIEIVETRQEGDEVHGGTYDPDSFNGKPHFCWVDRRALPWGLLSDKGLQKCARSINRPLWSCDRMAREIVSVSYSGTFTSRERLSMLSQVDKLSNAIGQCERIHHTAVPLNYARHALRSLTIWLLTLPFALIKDCGLLAAPVCGITAWLMFGVYQIGHSIEDPFQKTLRLSILCNAIRRDVLGETEYRSSAFSLDEIPTVKAPASLEGIPSAQTLVETILPLSNNSSVLRSFV